MKPEIEAKFFPVDKEQIKSLLNSLGAKQKKEETDFKRILFSKEDNPQIQADYLRVRDEGNLIRLSLKVHATEDGKVTDQKELEVKVSNFEDTVNLLQLSGFKKSSFQENKREIWLLNDSEVNIDTWPHLASYVEIESPSEEKLKETAQMLNFDWDNKIIQTVDYIYAKVYKISREEVKEKIRNLKFNHNPFSSN